MKTIGVVVVLTALVFALVMGAIALGSAARDDAAALSTPGALPPPAMSGELTRFGTIWCTAPSDSEAVSSNA